MLQLREVGPLAALDRDDLDIMAAVCPLAGETRPPVASVNLEPLFGDIGGHAPAIAAAVTSLRQASGADKVALVGHGR